MVWKQRFAKWKYEIHWPEMGIENDEDAAESDKVVNEWLKQPTLRKLLLTIYLGSELVRIVSLGAIAGGLLVGEYVRRDQLRLEHCDSLGFIAATAFAMSLDELAKRTTEYSVQYGAFVTSIVVVTSLVRLYLGFKSRRNAIDDPSTLASSLPIESIPILELYERRNRLL